MRLKLLALTMRKEKTIGARWDVSVSIPMSIPICRQMPTLDRRRFAPPSTEKRDEDTVLLTTYKADEASEALTHTSLLEAQSRYIPSMPPNVNPPGLRFHLDREKSRKATVSRSMYVHEKGTRTQKRLGTCALATYSAISSLPTYQGGEMSGGYPVYLPACLPAYLPQ